MSRNRTATTLILGAVGLTLLSACSFGGATARTEDGGRIDPKGADISLTAKEINGVGQVLTTDGGLVVYRFDDDTAEPSKSKCDENCADLRKPLIVNLAVKTDGLEAKTVGAVTRTDGERQATVNGQPLYTYAKDTAGSAKGQAVDGKWFAATPTGGRAGQAAAGEPSGKKAADKKQLLVADIAELGDIMTYSLNGGKSAPIYLTQNDAESADDPTCVGACAEQWIPVPFDPAIVVSGGIDKKLIGSVKRKDGIEQLTINQWPVHTYVGDRGIVSIQGHLKDDVWYLFTPKGEPLGVE
jgi:predicted lipoprotein with Yx(FWY)xxD motif